MSVEYHCLCAAEAFDFAVGSDAENLVATYGYSLLRFCAGSGIDLAVDDDEIDRAARIVALGPNDEAGDERGADDDSNENGRETRRHFDDIA
jgi:hypothetical protein